MSPIIEGPYNPSCNPRSPRDFEIYPRLGDPEDNVARPKGPGLVLSGGGGHIPDAYRWMHRVLTGDPNQRGGDIVVLRATPDDSYSAEIMKCAPFNSVQTICVPECATEEQLEIAAAIVAKAEGVFFAGGQQSRYVAWKDSTLLDSVQNVYDRGGVVGGTSAGLAILGEHVFDGKKARSSEVTSEALLEDPDNPNVTFTEDVFDFDPMNDVLTDTHFRERDRFGRLVTLLARQKTPRIIGVGVDERTALVIDAKGVGRVQRVDPDDGSVYLVQPESGVVEPNCPLGPVRARVTRLDEADQSFDFNAWTGTGDTYEVTVDGRERDPYSKDPYTGEASDSSKRRAKTTPR